jgi:large subunit ribosomal protein L19
MRRLNKERRIKMDIIKSVEHEQLKNKVPDIKIGDTVRVHQRIKEGNRQRIQVFEGIVIKKQNGGLNETFTVRRVAYGVGVEKTFLMHSPLVEKVEVVRVGKVSRAKLYYLRDRVGKAAKTKENIGANLNREDIVIKEDVPVEEVKEEVVETVETPAVEEVKAEETVETPVAEEAKAEETAEAPAEEAKTEEPAADENKAE